MNLILASVIGFLSQGLVLLQAWCAFRDRFLTVEQMKNRGFVKGLPFLAHLGMWGDALVISPLLSVIAAGYSEQWSLKEWLVALAAGFAMSFGMHWGYRKAKMPESHMHDGKLTKAGWMHFVYMGEAFAELFLFYFCTKGISHPFLILTSILLAAHMFAGTHMILGILLIRRILSPSWYGGRPLQSWPGWATNIAVWILLGGRCYYLMTS